LNCMLSNRHYYFVFLMFQCFELVLDVLIA
jgi:hypothetical protein